MVLTEYQKKEIDKLLQGDEQRKFFFLAGQPYEDVNDTINPQSVGKFFMEVYSYLKDRPNDQKKFLDRVISTTPENFLKQIKSKSPEFKELIENYQKEKQNPETHFTSSSQAQAAGQGAQGQGK